MRCTISHSITYRYPYNFIYKIVPMTGSTYPKKQKSNFNISLTNVKFKFSYKFGYIDQHKASLVLMVKSMFIYVSM